MNSKLGRDVKIALNVDIRDNVEIGDFSYVNKGSFIASGKIGKYCSIGYNTQIGIFEHPIGLLSTSPCIYRNKNIETNIKWSTNDINSPPFIGNDVWIGSNAIILQGVVIGDGAIIAAGAVVTKDIEPYCIVGGIPAKIIRKRFSDDIINYLLNLKWWDNSEEWIDDNINKILDIKKYINETYKE